MPPILPQVLAFSPAASEVGVPIDLSSVTIEFLTPMNRALTESAVSINPPIPFGYLWDDESQNLLLQFDELLSPLSDYTVTVSESATSADGQTMGEAASASWRTGRISPPLPPLPPSYPTLHRSDVSVVIDGNSAEWPVIPTDRNTAAQQAEKFLWLDSLGDDDGPGTYLYPTNSVFSGEDADLDEFRFAFYAVNVYFLFKPAAVNPNASFFTAFLGVAINLAVGGGMQPIGYNQAIDTSGVADLVVRSDTAPEFDVSFTGPRVALLLNRLTGAAEPATLSFSQATGVVEIAIPRVALGLSRELVNQPFNLSVYTALETFGGIRQVEIFPGEYEVGGGTVGGGDPNVFDLAGASLEAQRVDLSDYSADYQSTVLLSILPLVLSDFPEQRSEWTLF